MTALGLLAPDAETFGDHDFDHGADLARTVARESPATYVSANLLADDGLFGANHGVERWIVREVDGSRVGIFGVTTPELDAVPSGLTEVSTVDPVAAARDAEAELRAAGADAVDDDRAVRRTDVPVYKSVIEYARHYGVNPSVTGRLRER